MNIHEAEVIIKEHNEAIGGEENYRAFDALNFSTLSQLAKNPKFVNVEKEDQPYFVFGRYTEDLFMKEDMDKKYVVGSIPPPTGQMFTYVDALYKNGGDHPDAYNTVQEANGDTKLRTSPDKFIENFNKNGKAYYYFLKTSEGKSVISADEALLAQKMVVALDNLEIIQEFRAHAKYKIYFQVPLLSTAMGVAIKVLVDILVVDTEENILYPIDLKTSSAGLQEFSKSAGKYRYDIQASLYSYVISNSFANYSMHPFEFLVVSKYTPDTPKFFRTTTSDIYHGRFGIVTPYGTKIKGWEQLIEEYKKHKEADYWDLPVELWENTIQLDMYNYGG